MYSRTVSDTANRLLKRTDSEGSSSAAEKKSSAVPLFRSGHMSAICARLSKGKGRFTRGWKPQVSTLLCPRRVGALPAEVQRKTPRPLRANTPAAVRVPRSAGAEKKPPVRGEHAYAVRVPRSAGAEKTACAVRVPPDPPIPRKRKRHRSRGASPFCGYVGRSAAAVAAITAAAAGIITTGTAGTTAAAALTAAYPDQDDQDDNPPPGIFAPEAVRRTHTVISSYQRFHYILW